MRQASQTSAEQAGQDRTRSRLLSRWAFLLLANDLYIDPKFMCTATNTCPLVVLALRSALLAANAAAAKPGLT